MEELYGRRLVASECKKINPQSIKDIKKLPTMSEQGNTIQCLRCGSIHEKSTVRLSTNHYYCNQCIQFTRIESTQVFYYVPARPKSKRTVQFSWKGMLTQGQQVISDQLVTLVKEKKSGIVWAVTGAGKTEMLFHMLHVSLKAGCRIAIASPRVDVCLELFPRLQIVFPKETIALLYSEQPEEYQYTKLVLCTTHQLLRFYRAFDVVVIDEIDAFPFVNEPMLQYGAKQSMKPTGSFIYLTATPTLELRKKVQKKELELLRLPARYHRRPLPVPLFHWCGNWYATIMHEKFPRKILQCIQQQLMHSTPLIFCPSIQLMKKVTVYLQNYFATHSVAMVHAADEHRKEKVQNMRQGQYDLLVTSTILERGVTFKNVSVFILGANHAALVQISGRVDRTEQRSKGKVYFFHQGVTQAMVQAKKEIIAMNTLAKRRGLIDEL